MSRRSHKRAAAGIMTLAEDLRDEVVAYADRLGLTVTAAVVLLLDAGLRAEQARAAGGAG